MIDILLHKHACEILDAVSFIAMLVVVLLVDEVLATVFFVDDGF